MKQVLFVLLLSLASAGCKTALESTGGGKGKGGAGQGKAKN